MSGPAYPSTVPAGSFDVWQTVVSQYANSPILTGLIKNVMTYLDQTSNFDSFYNYIWNIATAQGVGLDIWGRIVGVGRVLNVPVGENFGFSEALPGNDTFGSATFFNGTPITQNYALSDDAYRLLILAKAAANITNCSIPAINQILLSLFPGRGRCYVIDGDPGGEYFGFAESLNAVGFGQEPFYAGQGIPFMHMSYVFEFPLSAVELAIVQQSGVIPKPLGVALSLIVNPVRLFVPFGESGFVTIDGLSLYVLG